MRLWLASKWEDIRTSFWFMPTLMVAAAVALSLATIHLDKATPRHTVERSGRAGPPRGLKTDHPAHGKSYYRCARHLYEATEQACFGLKATVVDDLVRDQVLHALESAALELSCRALVELGQ